MIKKEDQKREIDRMNKESIEEKYEYVGGEEEYEYMKTLLGITKKLAEKGEKISVIFLQKRLIIDHNRASILFKHFKEENK